MKSTASLIAAGTLAFSINNASALEFASEWPASNPTPNPTKKSDLNPQNRLQHFLTFSGKNYGVSIIGSNLDEDTSGDYNPNQLKLVGPQPINVPENATIEAAYLYYSGSIYYNEVGSSTIKDDTPDTEHGGEAPLDTAEDAANNEINVSIDGVNYPNLTPGNVGGNSQAMVSWWAINGKDGTLKDSKFGYYTNRLDITPYVHANSSTVEITRIQRIDFAGNQKNSNDGLWFHPPAAPNGNGQYANDCHSGASYSLVIIYALPAGPQKTLQIYDGASWVWDNDFATNSSKTYTPIAGPLAVDLTIDHEAIDNSQAVNLYISAIDGDAAWRPESTMPQCGSTSLKHGTGQDYTWVKTGNGAEKLYFNLYEGVSAPAYGLPLNDRPWENYNNVISMGKGTNYNIVKLGVQNPGAAATQTKLHWQADSANSTDKWQEGLALNFVIFEAALGAGGSPGNGDIPVITLNGNASVTLNVGDTYNEQGASASDTEDGDLTSSIVISGQVDTNTAGTYTINYDVSDSDNNAAVRKPRTVIVTAPFVCTEFTSSNSSHVTAGRATSQKSGSWWYNTTTYYAIGSNDNLGTSGTSSVKLAETTPGHYIKGNCPVTGPDTVAPTITLNGNANMSVSLNTTFTDPGAQAMDDRDGDISNQVSVSGAVNTAQEGTYTLIYSVSDAAGNSASKSRTVSVVSAPACTQYTDTNANHATAGRAEQRYGVLYYTIGSGEYLGLGTASTTLIETNPGSFKLGSC